MRCKKARGETAVADAGRWAAQGERKRASVVACAISSTEPGSGVSGAPDCAHNMRGASAIRLSSTSRLSSMHQYNLLNIRSTMGRLRRMARNPRYDILFEPVRIGPVTARNRFYAVPHAAGMTNSMPHMRAKFRETKAEGGWSVVRRVY